MPELPDEVVCACRHVLYDGEVVRARILRVRPDGTFEAKCRCKRWVPVPLELKTPVGRGELKLLRDFGEQAELPG